MPNDSQGAWMREYERLRLGIVAPHMPAEFDASLDALDAHVRGLVEENERLRAHRQRGESDGVL